MITVCTPHELCCAFFKHFTPINLFLLELSAPCGGLFIFSSYDICWVDSDDHCSIWISLDADAVTPCLVYRNPGWKIHRGVSFHAWLTHHRWCVGPHLRVRVPITFLYHWMHTYHYYMWSFVHHLSLEGRLPHAVFLRDCTDFIIIFYINYVGVSW